MNGFKYYLHYVGKGDGEKSWRCIDKTCRSVLKTYGENDQIDDAKSIFNHNHELSRSAAWKLIPAPVRMDGVYLKGESTSADAVKGSTQVPSVEECRDAIRKKVSELKQRDYYQTGFSPPLTSSNGEDSGEEAGENDVTTSEGNVTDGVEDDKDDDSSGVSESENSENSFGKPVFVLERPNVSPTSHLKNVKTTAVVADDYDVVEERIDDKKSSRQYLKSQRGSKKRSVSNECSKPKSDLPDKSPRSKRAKLQNSHVEPEQTVSPVLPANTKYERVAVFWDDPNELVQRLLVLVEARNRGRPNLENEIYSIECLLREGGWIK